MGGLFRSLFWGPLGVCFWGLLGVMLGAQINHFLPKIVPQRPSSSSSESSDDSTLDSFRAPVAPLNLASFGVLPTMGNSIFFGFLFAAFRLRASDFESEAEVPGNSLTSGAADAVSGLDLIVMAFLAISPTFLFSKYFSFHVSCSA